MIGRRTAASTNGVREAGFSSGTASSLRSGGSSRLIRPATTSVVASRAQREAGFTLVELLIVTTVMTMLMGMLSVLLNVAQRQSKISKTKATMIKVDQALRIFRGDMRVYPWQTDLSGADSDPSLWSNNLAYRLAWKPTAAERAAYLVKCQADLDRIHGRFTYRTGLKVGLPGGDGSHAFRTEEPDSGATQNTYVTNLMLASGSLADPDTVFSTLIGGDSLAFGRFVARLAPEAQPNGQVLSRLAAEISALKYLSGQIPVEAPQGIDPTVPADKAKHPNEDARYATLAYTPSGGTLRSGYRYIPYNRQGFFGDDRRGPALSTAEAQANGWRADYLASTLRRKASGSDSGEIDPSGTTILDAWGHPLVYVCQLTPGARGYTHPLRNIGSGVSEGRYGMAPTGREVTTSLASDVRTTAGSAYALEFELWSPGPDGRFAALRNDQVNRDNISLLSYTKGLE